MFPFDKKDRIRKPSMFGDFEGIFADFEEEMTRMMQLTAQPGSQNFVYGYRTYTGEDGKPVVEEYGNVPGLTGKLGGQLNAPSCSGACALPSAAPEQPADDTIEPYFDVLDEGDKIKIIVEMPGVEKKDIKLQSHDRCISLKAEGSTRTYAADIHVPDYVESRPKKAEYNNGVLAVTYSKDEKPTDVGVE